MSELSIEACSKQLREKIASESTEAHIDVPMRDLQAALEALRDAGFTKREFRNGNYWASK